MVNTHIAIKSLILCFLLKYNRNFVNSMNKDSENLLETVGIGAEEFSGEISLTDIKITTFSLRNKDYRVNDNRKYETHKFPPDKAFLYIFNDDAKCVEINVGYKNLWSYVPDEHGDEFPRLIYVRTVEKDVTVYFNDNMTRNYSLNYNKWSVNSGRLNYLTLSPVPYRSLVDLDINCKSTTERFKYTGNITNIDTYEAKGEYKFRVVKSGSRELWRSKFTKYANQVNIYHTNSAKIVLIMHLENGTRALSLKDEFEDIDWCEDAEQSEAFLMKVHSRTEERLATNHFKVITADDPNGVNPKENDVTKFVATTITRKCLFLHFNERIKYIELVHNDKTIWKYIDADGDDYIQSLHYVPVDKRIVVWFNDKLPLVYHMTDENVC
ncbi:hypothetical protein MACK_003440 [Theileria orientalis]|uniref:Uncharacterized protein n=1 Tax=Theileria orientalis TaxID=68886 RepID=A0A976XJF2_THEOR|nr:hypothetical protein MACK_003440 [Theileria orientalis]